MAADGQPELMLAYITCASLEEASRIGERLVVEHCAACINILPGMRSLYLWKGELAASEETVLIAKGTLSAAERLTARVKELHSYSCPCVIIVPIIGGHPPYLEWLRGEGRDPA
jgi:periplasmic divalent cation tolerance protein